MKQSDFALELFVRAMPFLTFALCLVFAWQYADVNATLGESGQAAFNLLHLGVIGNPYAAPTGPTAHVSPLHSALLALVFHFLGDYTREARLGLSVLCAVLYLLNCLLVLRICKLLDLHRVATAVAVLFVCALPLYQYDAIVVMRQWDQPLAALLMTFGLWLFLRVERAGGALASVLPLSVLAGVACLVSPSVFVAVAALIALHLLKKFRGKALLKAAGLSAIIVAACIVPWGLRNAEALGKFIVTRSNFGLELLVGNHDTAYGYSSGHEKHPFTSVDSAKRLAEVGEVAYMEELGNEAKQWIASDPLAFSALSIRRSWLLMMMPSPEPWFPVVGKTASAAAFGLLGIAKVLALLALLSNRKRLLVWVSCTLLPLAPYVLTHVNPRYPYLTFFTTACLIGWACDTALKRP